MYCFVEPYHLSVGSSIGAAGSTGDGGKATDAFLSTPYGLTDVSGNIYICDTGNNYVRKVNSAGTIQGCVTAIHLLTYLNTPL